MSPKPARTTDDAAQRLALYQAPGYLEIKRAQAALALLKKIDPDHMNYACPGMTAEDFEDAARSIAEDALASALTAAEQKITDAAKPAATVPPGPVAPRSGGRGKGEPA